ncbi:hypothetical protein HYH02_000357 [Chlamydomonas schloesseri]|uniref:GHMP kinase N-terminal domain-containing protein n=1 Tax=Chlamydomonas schloesseri TaxID=2026947 RepID=A0A835WVI6_9CHLO|nr:hypothetical protein HYH02_000357 [Chlamydomonas schloesseri]|eukprot:KAG2454510.1 hypothetical protein HYH02_000357 [Chlamydomonas schloesseri]
MHRTFARVGLFGNPSDQYYGRTIAFSLANFWAEVTLTPSADAADTAVRIVPHPVYDSTHFASLEQLVTRTSTEGLYGGVRLLLAACKRFGEHCQQHGIPLPPRRGFSLSYDTNVPRQTGLSGSSAIIYSALKCLADWYGLGEEQLPAAVRPGLVLSVEAGELGIAAGLQDRVVQVYGGVVHMDFDAEHMAAHGGAGRYSRLDPELLPSPLYIMYSENPSESGKVHSGVKAKWLAGDPEVRALMTRVAACGDEGLQLLLGHTPTGAERDRRLAELMCANFDLRHALFGDAVLGARNLRMVEIAKSVGAGVNFTGSGGAVVVFCKDGLEQAAALRVAAEAEGFTLVPVQVGPETAPLPNASCAPSS